MTFREFMIQKLEKCFQFEKKRETKTLTVFKVLPERNGKVYAISVPIPKPGTNGYEKNLGYAITQFVEVFLKKNEWKDDCLGRLIAEKEAMENDYISI